MSDNIRVESLNPSRTAIDALAHEARASGHAFLDRLIADWRSGVNRFDKPGECLLGLFDGGRLVAIGGLNRDPYCPDEARVGRLRHVYVAQSHRRKGIGRHLVTELLARAVAFERVRLRTPGAAAFYESLGFQRVDEPEATHAYCAPRACRD